MDRRRGWMQLEVQKFVEGMNVILKRLGVEYVVGEGEVEER